MVFLGVIRSGSKKFQLDSVGDHVNTCTNHSGVQKTHDWTVDQLPDLFHTTHKVKTQPYLFSQSCRQLTTVWRQVPWASLWTDETDGTEEIITHLILVRFTSNFVYEWLEFFPWKFSICQELSDEIPMKNYSLARFVWMTFKERAPLLGTNIILSVSSWKIWRSRN